MSGPKSPNFGRAFVEAFLHYPKPRLKSFLDDIERTVILGAKYTTPNEKIKRYRIRFDQQP